MSRRFKAPRPVTLAQRKRAQVARLAAQIPDQEAFERILADSDPMMRACVREMLTPHLTFELQPESLKEAA